MGAVSYIGGWTSPFHLDWHRVGRHWTVCGCENPGWGVHGQTPRTVYLCKIYQWCIFILPKLVIFRQKFVGHKMKDYGCFGKRGVQSVLTRRPGSLRWQMTLFSEMTNTWRHCEAWQHPWYFCFLTSDNSAMTLTSLWQCHVTCDNVTWLGIICSTLKFTQILLCCSFQPSRHIIFLWTLLNTRLKAT